MGSSSVNDEEHYYGEAFLGRPESPSSSSSSSEEIGSDYVEMRRRFLRSYKLSSSTKPSLMKKMKQCLSQAKRRLTISSWQKQRRQKLLKPLIRVKRLVWAKLRPAARSLRLHRSSVCCCNSHGCPRFFKASQQPPIHSRNA